MPELPEVETTCRGIKPHLVNKQITEVIFRHKQLRWPIPTQILKKNLLNQTILEVKRRAKYIVIRLSTGYFVIHLGMSGTLRILQKPTLPRKHDHFECKLSSGEILRFNDPRRFGALLWTPSLESLPQLQHLGPEPLSAAMNAAYFYHKAQKSRCHVKTFMMNNQVVVGVGNIYANESLYLAGLHPLQPVNSLNLTHFKTLAKKIKEVLTKAIKQGGTTLKDFTQADGSTGYFQTHLNVYGREGEGCYQCNTFIQNQKIGGRSTYFCPNCQPFIG